MTLHKFVFSPTGGTKKAAAFLCQNWAGKENKIAKSAPSKMHGEMTKNLKRVLSNKCIFFFSDSP